VSAPRSGAKTPRRARGSSRPPLPWPRTDRVVARHGNLARRVDRGAHDGLAPATMRRATVLRRSSVAWYAAHAPSDETMVGTRSGRSGVAARSEGRAVVLLLQAAQDEAADAFRRLGRVIPFTPKRIRGVLAAVLRPQAITALGDGTDTAPGAVAHLEHLEDQLLRGRSCLRRAPIDRTDFRPTFPRSSRRAPRGSTPSSMSIGSKPVTTIGTP